MIPTFPTFKSLELPDKRAVERLTKVFPAYSDFNFTSLWVWNIKNAVKISKLNGNLVVLFADYVTGEPFLSFIGDKKVSATAFQLLSYAKVHFKQNFLKLIPEELAPYFSFKDSPFIVHHDRADADYIYLSDHLMTMREWSKNPKGKALRKYLSTFPEHKVVVAPLSKINKDHYLDVFHKWSLEKHGNHAFDLNEFKAFERFLGLADTHIVFVSLYVGDELAGFSAYELLPKHYAVAHFSKAHTSVYPGVYEILNWEEGKVMHAKGVKFLNWEQDLGIPGLRHAKEKYRPYFLLKKIMVTLP